MGDFFRQGQRNANSQKMEEEFFSDFADFFGGFGAG
jgi:hypothetical protein